MCVYTWHLSPLGSFRASGIAKPATASRKANAVSGGSSALERSESARTGQVTGKPNDRPSPMVAR